VSRWWPERVRLGLGDGHVEVLRGGAAPVVVRFTPTADAQPWTSALDALDEALRQARAQGGAAHVVLSSRWTRYAVLPWHDGVMRRRELEQLARLHFERAFGAMSAQWALRVASGRWGQPQLACAVDGGLVDALTQRLARRGLRLRSMQPLLVAAHNGRRRRLRGQATLLLLEPTRLCLARTDGGGWQHVVVRRGGSEVARVIDQEMALLAGSANAPPLDVLLVGDDVQWPEAPTRPVRRLSRRSLAACAAA
jgi:hypothetical protein